MSKESFHFGRRRSGRITQELPVQISGIDLKEGKDFIAATRTLVLSRYGAKILLKQALVPDQEISIYCPKTGKDWEARIVAFFTTESEGYTYGVEFLDKHGNFWNLPFPAGAGATDSVSPVAMPVPPFFPEADKPLAPEVPVPRAAVLEEPPKANVAKNYAVRLQCPLGEEDQWIILQDREESLQQILDLAWDFECPIHGLQREFPLEASETRLTHLPTPLPQESVAGSIEAGGSNAEPLSGGRPSQESRIPQAHRVWVRGVDYKGNPFLQSAFSINISRSGGRLDGLGLLIRPGDTVEVRRLWRKAVYRVVWTGQRGTPQANHIGICCLEPNKNVWNLAEAAQSLWRSFEKNISRSR